MRFRLALTLISCLLVLVGCTGNSEERARRFVDLGNKYFEKGQYQEASIMYRKALQHDRLSAEAYYRLGLTSLEQEKPGEALEAFTRVFELDPENIDAFHKLADIHLAALAQAPASGRGPILTSLIHHTERLEKLSSDSYEVLYVKGRMSLAQKEYENALQFLAEAEKARPGMPETAVATAGAHLGMGDVATGQAIAAAGRQANPEFADFYTLLYLIDIQASRMDEAGEILRERCSRADDTLVCWLSLANHYHNLRQPERNADVIDSIVENRESYEETLKLLAEFLVRTGQPDKAMEVCELGLAEETEPAVPLRYTMIQARLLKGDTEEATRIVDELLAEDSGDGVALGYRGGIRMAERTEEAYESARADLREAVSALPTNYNLRFMLGRANLALGDVLEAKRQFEEVHRLEPKHRPSAAALMGIHLNSGEYTQAEMLAESLIDRNPTDIQARMSRVVAWMGLREYEKARQGLENIEKMAPNLADVAHAFGRLELLEQRLPQAERRFRDMVQAFPRDTRGVIGLVDTMLASGRPAEAQTVLDAASRAWPESAGWRVALADLSVGQGDTARAEQEYRIVLESHPENGVANLRIGELHLRRGDFDLAREHFNKAWSATPPQPFAAYHLGTMHAGNGEYAEARDWLEKSLELAPDLPVALNNLAFVLGEMNVELDQALTYAQRAVARVPGYPDFQDTLGLIYTKRQLYSNAIGVLETLVREHPDRADFRYHLAVAFYRNQNPERARQEFRAALQGQLPDKDAQQAQRLLQLLGG